MPTRSEAKKEKQQKSKNLIRIFDCGPCKGATAPRNRSKEQIIYLFSVGYLVADLQLRKGETFRNVKRALGFWRSQQATSKLIINLSKRIPIRTADRWKAADKPAAKSTKLKFTIFVQISKWKTSGSTRLFVPAARHRRPQLTAPIDRWPVPPVRSVPDRGRQPFHLLTVSFQNGRATI